MSEILIIGSKGTLGSYLTQFFSSSCTVRAFNDRFSGKHSHTNKLAEFIQEHSIQTVINCVGATDVNRCQENRDYAYSGNTLVPEIVAKIQEESTQKFLTINFSTDQVYPGTGDALETQTAPINVYGSSKLAGETLLSNNACNLRINYVSKGKNRTSFSDWVVHTAQNQDRVTLYNDIYFNPLDIKTLAKCVKHVVNNQIIGTYNLGGLSKLSKAEFYTLLTHKMGIENPNTKLESYSSSNTIPRPLDMSMNVSKSLQHGFILPTISNMLDSLSKEYTDAN